MKVSMPEGRIGYAELYGSNTSKALRDFIGSDGYAELQEGLSPKDTVKLVMAFARGWIAGAQSDEQIR